MKNFFLGFKYAFNGLLESSSERNMKIHLLVGVMSLVAGWWFGISQVEWVIIIMLIGMVLAAEIFNTAVEELADLLKDEEHLDHQATKRVRDLAAGAVLVTAIAAGAGGFIIFLPKI